MGIQGRPRAIDPNGLRFKEMVDLYFEERYTFFELADKFSVSERTIRKYFKKAKIQSTRKGRPHYKNSYSCVVKWVGEHPEVELPRSSTEMAKLTNCSLDAVKSYFYRKRRDIKKKLQDLPNLRKANLKFKKNETIYYSQDFLSYSISVDYYTEKLKVKADLPTGQTMVFQLSLSVLEKALQTNRG